MGDHTQGNDLPPSFLLRSGPVLPGVVDLAQHRRPSLAVSLWQLANTAVPFALCWWAMLASLSVGWWLTWLLALPTAGLTMRLFVIQHDCGHGSFFRSRAANDWLGRILGVLTITPYRYWRHTHALHHAHHGKLEHRHDLGYFQLLTVGEYRRLPPRARLGYRLYRNPLVFMLVGPVWQFFLKHRLPLDLPRSARAQWASVLGTNLGMLALGGLVAWQVGLGRFLMVQAPVSYLAAALGMWLFYVQHTFEGAAPMVPARAWDHRTSALAGSSFYDLPRPLAWLTGDIGLHHVHHLDSRIPNYRLRDCLTLEEISQVPALSFGKSLRAWRLSLCDERTGRLVGFRDADLAEV
jgi:omega-6 fatty acid desaturase (delta-12 desaturase)